jgi:hypothetical protein
MYPDAASDAAHIAGPSTILVRKSARLFIDGISRMFSTFLEIDTG